MDDLLNKLYKDPSTGYAGPLKLWKFALHYDNNIKLSDVKKWMNKQSSYQVHQTVREPKNFYPIVANFKNHKWQADLLDVSRDSHKNKGINFLLIVIDVYTRYVYAEPLKKKNRTNVVNAMKEILKKEQPQIITTDAGSEFISAEFKNLFEGLKIEHRIAEVADHNKMGIVERFNRTLREMIEKYKTLKGLSWIDDLPNLINNYNTSFHTSLNGTPSNPNESYIKKRYETRIANADKSLTKDLTGLDVRYVLNRGAFSKGSEAKLSKTIHTVVARTLSNEYLLSNGKYFKPYQLYIVPKGTVLAEIKAPLQEVEVKEIQELPKLSRNFLNKEGIKLDNRKKGLRERIPNVKLSNDRYGQILGGSYLETTQ